MELRGIVSNMGDNTNLTTCYFGSPAFNEVFAGYVRGETNGTPLNPIVTYEVELNASEDYVVAFGIDTADSEDCDTAGFSLDEPFVFFTTPAIGDPIDVTTHPLAGGISDLNLPVDTTLALIGMAIVAAPLVIATVFGNQKFPPGNSELVPLVIIGISAAVALRFWPPVVIVFLGLFVGWAVVDAFTTFRQGRGQ